MAEWGLGARQVWLIPLDPELCWAQIACSTPSAPTTQSSQESAGAPPSNPPRWECVYSKVVVEGLEGERGRAWLEVA